MPVTPCVGERGGDGPDEGRGRAGGGGGVHGNGKERGGAPLRSGTMGSDGIPREKRLRGQAGGGVGTFRFFSFNLFEEENKRTYLSIQLVTDAVIKSLRILLLIDRNYGDIRRTQKEYNFPMKKTFNYHHNSTKRCVKKMADYLTCGIRLYSYTTSQGFVFTTFTLALFKLASHRCAPWQRRKIEEGACRCHGARSPRKSNALPACRAKKYN